MEYNIGNAKIGAFDGRKFKPFMNNRSFDIEFDTYEECIKYIIKHNLDGYSPKFGWDEEGHYHSNYHWLMSAWIKFRDLKLPNKLKNRHSEWIEYIGRSILKAPIDVAFKKMVEGVDWYNSL